MGLHWRKRYAHLKIAVSGQTFVQGFASGNGFNCLLDTLKQQLNVEVNVSRIRIPLGRKHTRGSAANRP
eukprot:6753104-Karenia_brevis.AAC.1